MNMKFGTTLKNCRHLMECAKELGVQIVGVKWVISLSSTGWADVCMMYFRCKIEKNFSEVTLFYRVKRNQLNTQTKKSPQFGIMSFRLQAQTSMKQSNYYRHQNNMKWSIINPSVGMKTKFGSLSYSLAVLFNFCGNSICIFSAINIVTEVLVQHGIGWIVWARWTWDQMF